MGQENPQNLSALFATLKQTVEGINAATQKLGVNDDLQWLRGHLYVTSRDTEIDEFLKRSEKVSLILDKQHISLSDLFEAWELEDKNKPQT